MSLLICGDPAVRTYIKEKKGIMRKNGKRFWMWIALIILLVLAVAFGTQAASKVIQVQEADQVITYTKGTIDTELDTSLHIRKYSSAKEGIAGDGLYMEGTVQEAVPLSGVVFKYLKVADLVQSEAEPAVALKYDLQDRQVASALDLIPGVYTSDVLVDALQNANQDEVWRETLEQVTDRKGTAMEPTGSDGKTSAKGLKQGLYLVIESEVPANVYERTNPFFVSLPMTNAGTVVDGDQSYEPGTLWQYDVFLYPKNKADTPEIQKHIVEGSAREKYASAGVGDTVLYEIRSQVPGGADALTRYAVTDCMSEGLTFQEIQSVTVGETQIPVERLQISDGEDGLSFVIEFITATGNLLQGHGGEDVIVTYTAILNENCVVTSEGNPNHASLIYGYDAGIHQGGSADQEDSVVDDVADPRVYTYGIDLTKINKEEEPLAGVEFELYREDKTTRIGLKQKTSTNKAYQDVTSYCPDQESENGVITTDKNGRAYIWGLTPGTYYLKETKTLEGYILLENMIQIKVQDDVSYEVETENRGGTYGLIPQSNVPVYYKLDGNGIYKEYQDMSQFAGTYANFGTNKIYTKDAQGTYVKVPMYYPTVKADVEAAKPYGTSDMNVVLSVLNNPVYDIPETGGSGTHLFLIGGIVLIMGASLIWIIKKRKIAG